MMKKAIVYGLGRNYYFYYYYIYKKYDVIALCDKNENARTKVYANCMYKGERIVQPKEISNILDDDSCILVTVEDDNVRKEICGEISSLGVSLDNIEYLDMIDVGPFLLDPLFFKMDLSAKDKEELFCNNVEHITVEVNSKCNRKCWFCPNSVLDRNTSNYVISREVFGKIIEELEMINYKGVLTYSFYNEPLLDENIFEKIETVKGKLTNCKQLITTNGDYLDDETLTKLVDAGLDYLIVSVYGINNPNVNWNQKDAMEENRRIIERAHIPIIYEEASDNMVISYGKRNECYIRLQNYNFKEVGHNRGEILPDDLPLKKVDNRNIVCSNPFTTLNIYYNGDIIYCGNMRHDYDKHRQFIIGNIKQTSMVDAFSSDNYRGKRKMFLNDLNMYPCATCSRNGNGTFIPIYPGAPIQKRPRFQNMEEK